MAANRREAAGILDPESGLPCRSQDRSDKVLEALAERSGGDAMFPGDTITLGATLDKLGDLIRSRYLVAYSPADFVPDGSYRTIRIKAEKDGKHLQVHARKGYYARLEATTSDRQMKASQ